MARLEPISETALRMAWTVALGLAGCAARGAQPTTPPRSELVVDEATVVTAGPRRDARGLPPLPVPLESSSEAFRRAHGLALAELDAEGPPPLAPGADEQSYQTWTEGPFARWLSERSARAQAAAEALGAVREGPPAEHVVAAALVGLVYTRLTDQLSAIPPPAHLAQDRVLAAHYEKGLDDASAGWRQAATDAYFHCAKRAAEQTASAFGLWLELCHEQLRALEARRDQAAQRSAWLAAESEAARLEAAGPPPPGPEICWKPHAAQPAAGSGDEPTAAAPHAASGDGPCALSPTEEDALAPPPARDARDSLYGPRDAATGVRVAVATEQAPTMDLRPLAAAATQSKLAACFARHVKEEDAVTVAVHASFSVTERGRVKSAQVAGEPSDEARAPSKVLERCLVKALKQVRFDCSPSGYPTQGKAIVCMRRD